MMQKEISNKLFCRIHCYSLHDIGGSASNCNDAKEKVEKKIES